MKAEIYSIVKDLILQYINYCDIDSNFKNDLGFDSLDKLDLIIKLERKLDITISDEEIEIIKTVKDLVELINKKQ